MSVRRLDPVQPESFAFTPANLIWAKEAIRKYPEGKQASAVIPLLWRAQEQNEGWVSRPAMEYVADMLGMSFIRVYEVATFYTMFQLSPVGRKAHVQVCGTTPCMLRGSEELMKVCRHRISPEQHHLSADGDFSWEEVECLGACVNAPMVQIWSDTYEDLTPETFEKVLDFYANGKRPKPGPQNGRQFSAPEGELTSLTDKALYGKERTFTRMEAPPPAPPAQPAAAAPPSNAAKPQPAAAETAPAVKSPSPVKTAEAPVALAKMEEKAGAQPKKPETAAPADRVESKPELLTQPRSGKGDDLKLIWGVGPKLEKMLHDMGVWHFDQIASWTRAELKWVDARLEGFKGRAERDEWVKQAQKLATGWRPDNAVGEKPGK
ncbi:NADH-quinone oxidoreductase subunit NuoE [Taklimakanibacter deserti]|uniref:NADH-quinone oxidoreductase subunit NuoE n=1 Tax=Taklimakanibacter deserti TaxID=2267839 RepID=UPI000E64D130